MRPGQHAGVWRGFRALIAWIVFRENADRRIVLGMASIVAGALVLSWPGARALARRSPRWPWLVPALPLLGEMPMWPLLAAAVLMGIGVWLHLSERHEHAHTHEALEHSHEHVHDEHHQHDHAETVPQGTRHTHLHKHESITHTHPHYPDAHHRHKH